MAGEVLLKVLRGGYVRFDRIVKLDTPLGDNWLTPLYVTTRGLGAISS